MIYEDNKLLKTHKEQYLVSFIYHRKQNNGY